jgi:hypothetical protein
LHHKAGHSLAFTNQTPANQAEQRHMYCFAKIVGTTNKTALSIDVIEGCVANTAVYSHQKATTVETDCRIDKLPKQQKRS